MTRIAPVHAPFSPDIEPVLAELTPAGMTPLVLFRTLARSPRVFRKFRAGALLDKGPLSLRHRELVILRTCALAGNEYEWGVHVTLFGPRAGFTEAQLAATVHGAGHWDAPEAALLAAAEQLHDTTRLDDEAWGALRAHFDEPQVLEVLAVAGFYRTVSLFVNALQLPLESYAARFPARPSGARNMS